MYRTLVLEDITVAATSMVSLDMNRKKYTRTANCCPTYANKQRPPGLTIIEVLVVVAIISIMAIVGIPSLQDFIRRAHISSQAHEFVGTMSYARSEAVKRGQRVTVCKSADGSTCATAGNWDQGWIVFVDANNDNARQTGEELLRVRGSLDDGMTLVGNTNVATSISYLSHGGLAGLGTGTIILCYPESTKGIGMVFIRTGRVRTEAATCS